MTRKVRSVFAAQVSQLVFDLAPRVRKHMLALVDASKNAREMQDRRDAWLDFRKNEVGWIEGCTKAFRQALQRETFGGESTQMADFTLLGNDVVENNILSSRLSLRILDKVAEELNDLRMRVQFIEAHGDMEASDILRPETVAKVIVEQWTKVGQSRESWLQIQDIVQQHLSTQMPAVYKAANDFLISQGILPKIDTRSLVKRSVGGGAAPDDHHEPDHGPDSGAAPGGGMGHSGGAAQGRSQHGYQGSAAQAAGRTGAFMSGGAPVPRPPAGGAGAGVPASSAGRGEVPTGDRSSGGGAMSSMGMHEETRMLTSSTPLARVRMRAQGVMGQLRRLLSDKVADFDHTRPQKPSAPLIQAIDGHVQAMAQPDGGFDPDAVAVEQVHVDQAIGQLRERTTELKRAASTSSEKATIEIVALMFQSILAEERIAPAIRVWFARLQMPVLRVALSEPEFFGSLQHPARRLIDRMGSCVLGFDATVTGNAMEIEIKRIVQVIEQYPETGRRVFQLVYDEFQKFLSKFLTGQAATQRVVSVAQQVEQKETMAIQFTIELRNMLGNMPVRDEIREFLFKIWAEVLAIAAVKSGAQHQETMQFKQAAADLVWAASAKPNRNDRARVIQDLPRLLQRLRLGMSLLGMVDNVQDKHIKTISDTLADAFMSKTEVIEQSRIDEMAKRLGNLEDYITEDGVGDLPLDAESMELMLGIDTSDIEIITDGGSEPTEAMRAWAKELQQGAWFSLDHNGHLNRVQFVWRSDQGQLYLFASPSSRTFLMQTRRLAAYLQAGLLTPIEDEALTVRATREALAKLDANPERLLT